LTDRTVADATTRISDQVLRDWLPTLHIRLALWALSHGRDAQGSRAGRVQRPLGINPGAAGLYHVAILDDGGNLGARLLLGRPWFRHLSMLFSEDAGRGDVCNRRLQFVLPAADDIAVAPHHGVEPDARHIRRIILRALPDLCVRHVRTLEEIRFRSPGHEAVTVTPVSFSSARSAKENESTDAVVPL
jgi:hypothetical protein